MSSLLRAVACAVTAASVGAANQPPLPPVINEPAVDGQIVNPADVHMETGPFQDPDVGDQHLCTDWEIWTLTPPQRVWVTACIGGVERVHTHLGDGVFEGSHTGRSELVAATQYFLRVRHRDDSGDALTEWSDWSVRFFETGPLSEVFPLELSDVAPNPAPMWHDATGVAIVLPGGGSPALLEVGSASGDLLLRFAGLDGLSNEVTNPPGLPDHVDARVVVSAGTLSVSLPESDLAFTTEDGEDVTIYLPSIGLDPGTGAVFWVAANGGTYVGHPGDTEPDFSVLARGAPVPWTVAQPGFVVEVVATGFQLPVNIAFVPSPGPEPDAPLYYVTELYGNIKVVMRDGAVGDFASGLLNFNPTGNFPGSGEQGLTGIVVDPASGDVFASMLYSTDPNNDNAPHYPKVDRFTSVDGGRTAATRTTILDMVGETQGQSHQISNLSFGPDAKLYVHMGDGFDASTAQNLGSFRGKILRLDSDGSAPVDNPFYNGAPITSRDYVFALGVRNPFGGAWRESDSMHYTVENGPSVDRFSQTVAGRNYLWDGSDASMMNFAIYNWSPAHAPVNIAFVQAGTSGGSGFPASRYDHAYIAESGPTWATGFQSLGKRITEWVLDGGGALVDGPRDLAYYAGAGKATAAAIAAGPDGLYFSDLYKDQDYQSPIDRGANILRIRYVGTADFGADVRFGDRPLVVSFSDRSDVPGAYEWTWTFGDGSSSQERDPIHVYGVDGVYDVRLAVRGTVGTRVVQKNGYVKVGQFPSVAMIGGSIPPSASDQAIATFLDSAGFQVTSFDDDRSNRPSAAELAGAFDVVVVSSTVASSNIAGDFRDEEIPIVLWEQALLRTDREPLADDGMTIPMTQQITIVNNTHPITEGFALGELAVFGGGATMSVGRGNFAPGAQVLATRAGVPADASILVAEAGAALLGGHSAPARRVFLFLEDASWLGATDVTRTILERSVAWASGFTPPGCPADLDGDGDADGDDFFRFLDLFAAGDPGADLDGDGDRDADDFFTYLDLFVAGC
ncbi:MAG: PQQ-dependent sugar dehydrogenase [Phycisphaeraceae bacterium]|nr:PQQ-dependent sugar dehydrogenase [Phycisphaeraceae bacterium]